MLAGILHTARVIHSTASAANANHSHASAFYCARFRFGFAHLLGGLDGTKNAAARVVMLLDHTALDAGALIGTLLILWLFARICLGLAACALCNRFLLFRFARDATAFFGIWFLLLRIGAAATLMLALACAAFLAFGLAVLLLRFAARQVAALFLAWIFASLDATALVLWRILLVLLLRSAHTARFHFAHAAAAASRLLANVRLARILLLANVRLAWVLFLLATNSARAAWGVRLLRRTRPGGTYFFDVYVKAEENLVGIDNVAQLLARDESRPAKPVCLVLNIHKVLLEGLADDTVLLVAAGVDPELCLDVKLAKSVVGVFPASLGAAHTYVDFETLIFLGKVFVRRGGHFEEVALANSEKATLRSLDGAL
jgi:hypothetical protein